MLDKEFAMKMEEPLRRLRSGVNAVELMVLGLVSVQDPYADGFHAVWACLQEAEQDIQELWRSECRQKQCVPQDAEPFSALEKSSAL